MEKPDIPILSPADIWRLRTRYAFYLGCRLILTISLMIGAICCGLYENLWFSMLLAFLAGYSFSTFRSDEKTSNATLQFFRTGKL